MRSLAAALLLVAEISCATAPSSPEGPRVAATGDNVDHYGRPTDAGARECYDRCMLRTDLVDSAFGGDSYKTDERQQSACWDRCAPRARAEICDPGEALSCSCLDPSDFNAKPLLGTRTCMGDGTKYGSCDCTQAAAGDAVQPAAEPGPLVDPLAADKPNTDPCKAAIKTHCVAACEASPAAERGPCEVKCMREPAESFDGKLKECTPDLADY